MATAQFFPLNASTIALDTIVPNNVNSVTIQLLSSSGIALESYQYMDWAGPNYDQTAWADLNGVIATDVSFEPGQGLWIQANSTADKICTAGQVGTSDVAITLKNGFTPAGNPFPIRVALQDLVVNNVNTVTIQLLSSSGVALESYQYMDWAGPNYDQTAWADLNGTIAEGIYIEPGQGLWIQGSSTSDIITFPAPEL